MRQTIKIEDVKYCKVQPLKDNVFLLQRNKDFFIYKTIDTNRLGGRGKVNLLNRMGFLKAYLKKEILFNKELTKREFTFFFTPALVSYSSDFMLSKYITGSEKVDEEILFQKIFPALEEFSESKAQIKRGGRIRFIDFFTSPYLLIIRGVFTYIFRFSKSDGIKIIFELISFFVFSKKGKKTIHKDLHWEETMRDKRVLNNVIITNNKVCFIDLASTMLSSLIYYDICSVTYSQQENFLDLNQLRYYLNRHCQFDWKSENEMKCLRFSLLAATLSRTRINSDKDQFIMEKLSSFSRFKRWIKA